MGLQPGTTAANSASASGDSWLRSFSGNDVHCFTVAMMFTVPTIGASEISGNAVLDCKASKAWPFSLPSLLKCRNQAPWKSLYLTNPFQHAIHKFLLLF